MNPFQNTRIAAGGVFTSCEIPACAEFRFETKLRITTAATAKRNVSVTIARIHSVPEARAASLAARCVRRRSITRPPRHVPSAAASVMERQHIGPLRQFDDDLVFGSISPWRFPESFTRRPSRLHPHHRIQLRIEVGGPPKHFRRNLIFLDGSSRVIQDVASQITQQFAQGFRTVQHVAVR